MTDLRIMDKDKLDAERKKKLAVLMRNYDTAMKWKADRDEWVKAHEDLLEVRQQDLRTLGATIADLRERHDAFVRKVRVTAFEIRVMHEAGSYDGIRSAKIVALCDAEIGKEGA